MKKFITAILILSLIAFVQTANDFAFAQTVTSQNTISSCITELTLSDGSTAYKPNIGASCNYLRFDTKTWSWTEQPGGVCNEKGFCTGP